MSFAITPLLIWHEENQCILSHTACIFNGAGARHCTQQHDQKKFPKNGVERNSNGDISPILTTVNKIVADYVVLACE